MDTGSRGEFVQPSHRNTTTKITTRFIDTDSDSNTKTDTDTTMVDLTEQKKIEIIRARGQLNSKGKQKSLAEVALECGVSKGVVSKVEQVCGLMRRIACFVINIT